MNEMISTLTPVSEQVRQVRATYLLKRGSLIARFGNDGQFDLPSPRVLRNWDGLNNRRAGSQESIWQKICRFASQHEVDPIHLVKAAFWDCMELKPPLPHDLLRPQLIEEARRYEDNRREDLSYTVSGWVSQAETHFVLWRRYRPELGDEYHWRCVISSPEVSLGALFRYTLASSLGLHDTAELFFDRALSEYLTDPDSYDAVMGEKIPKKIREEGGRRLQEIYAQLGG